MPNTRGNRIALVLLVVAALVGGLVVASGLVRLREAAAGEQVVLEPAHGAGESPFAPPPPIAAPAEPKSSAGGEAPGVNLESQVCNPQDLIAQLQADPRKAAAWIGAVNSDPTLRWSGGTSVQVDQLPAFIRELVPRVLPEDLRVTNHRYTDGRPTSVQSVLQKGTPVLVDMAGVARVRCTCGNPLTVKKTLVKAPRYDGEPWPEFRKTDIVVIAPDQARCGDGQYYADGRCEMRAPRVPVARQAPADAPPPDAGVTPKPDVPDQKDDRPAREEPDAGKPAASNPAALVPPPSTPAGTPPTSEPAPVDPEPSKAEPNAVTPPKVTEPPPADPQPPVETATSRRSTPPPDQEAGPTETVPKKAAPPSPAARSVERGKVEPTDPPPRLATRPPTDPKPARSTVPDAQPVPETAARTSTAPERTTPEKPARETTAPKKARPSTPAHTTPPPTTSTAPSTKPTKPTKPGTAVAGHAAPCIDRDGDGICDANDPCVVREGVCPATGRGG